MEIDKLLVNAKCKLSDDSAAVLLSVAKVGTVIKFSDYKVLVEETNVTGTCKHCIFFKERGDNFRCPKFSICSARYRQDRTSVLFTDKDVRDSRKAERRERDRREYARKKLM